MTAALLSIRGLALAEAILGNPRRVLDFLKMTGVATSARLTGPARVANPRHTGARAVMPR